MTERASKTAASVIRTLGVFSLVVCALACSKEDPHSRRIVTRLISDGDSRSSSSAVFYDTIEVQRWEFDTDQKLAEWTPERIDTTFESNEDGLLLESSSADPSVFRHVDLQADRIKAIRITQSGLTSDAYMQLYWAPKGEPFSESRTLGCATQDVTGSLIPSYTFRVENTGITDLNATIVDILPPGVTATLGSCWLPSVVVLI